jgi:hypothetical protein
MSRKEMRQRKFKKRSEDAYKRMVEARIEAMRAAEQKKQDAITAKKEAKEAKRIARKEKIMVDRLMQRRPLSRRACTKKDGVRMYGSRDGTGASYRIVEGVAVRID